jgi:hypothetical protein
MKLVFGTLAVLAFSTEYSFAQQGKFDFSKLQINHLTSAFSKGQVVQRLGQPLAVADPHYECGEYVSQPKGVTFYQLRYRQATFIGNAKQGYELEAFRFAPAGPARLTYAGQPLSAATTLPQLTRLLGPLETHKNKDGSVEVVVWERDASAIFTFRAGKLASYAFHGVGC